MTVMEPTPSPPYEKFYQQTDYPHIYCPSYWGNFGKTGEVLEELTKQNRNHFASYHNFSKYNNYHNVI